MNRDDLYERDYHENGIPIFYVDKQCTQKFSGHMVEYDNGRKIYEGTIVDGLENGICKDYEDKFIWIQEKCNNELEGFSIAYYRNGKIKSISLNFGDLPLCAYSYNEDGTQDEINKYYRPLEFYKRKEKYSDFIKKYDLKSMNEDVLQNGKISNLPADFKYENIQKESTNETMDNFCGEIV